MDSNDQNKTTGTTGLPRVSRLPQSRPSQLPQINGSGIARYGQSTPASGLTTRGNRQSMIIPPSTVPLSQYKATSASPKKNNRQSVNLSNGYHKPTTSIDTPASKPVSHEQISELSTVPVAAPTHQPISIRKPRPSLADRTMETLAQIPPSPTPRRRQSGFFGTESPMRPPSRAAAGIGTTRPASRAGLSSMAIARTTERPASPSKRPPSAASRTLQGVPTPGRRSVSSSYTPRAKANSMSIPSLATPIKPLRPGPVRPGTTAISSTTKALNGTRTVSAGHPPPKSPIKGLFDIPKWTEDDAHKVQPSISRSTTLMSSPIEGDSRYEVQQGTSPVKAAEISPKRLGGGTIRLPPHSPVRPVDKSPRSSGNGPVIPLASQALRETIAKAKAARRSIEKNNAFVPRFVEEESKNIVPMNAGLGLDLGIIDVTENATTSLIKQRIRTARKDGKLNIAALGLHEIPREVLRMYDFDEKSDTKWYENVDLTRLIAADNEIAELREEDFPEESLESFDAISDEASSSVFAGLELMDLHGNQLKALPAGLGKLYRLTTLNLNRNKLNDGCLGVVFGILSLKELRIGENSLTGILPSSISDLQSLEILDIHGNSITELPDSIGKLSNLKTLDVSGNRLSSLPFEAIFDLPLVEILARKNRLSGALIPSNVTRMESLKTLEAANNALQSLTEASIEFPALQTIDISNNRISALPAVSSWAQAITINVQENKISALPQGFTTLKKLKLADFSDNSLLHIEDEIALMENLAMLRISNNPIRERRFLKMSTEDVKAELKARLEAPQSPASVRSGFGSIDRAFDTVSSTWVVKSGILDRSSSRLKKINAADLEPIRSEDISSLILHHNWIQEIPMSIGVLGNTLTTLDLSHNKLGKSCDFLSTPLSLPNLQVLNLTSNALTTLDPLVTHLSAPKLTTLILLFNRLTSLPLLCPAFPALTKLLASNNAIATLNVNGLRNLQVLDVSSNEIEKLPPQLALLQGQLRTLMINGNKFRVPGWGILEKGTEAILDWCRLKIPAGQEGNMDG